MNGESNDFQAQHDGERDRMMYKEKPSFKSYYKSRLFPTKNYGELTICEKTGVVFVEKGYRLSRALVVVFFLAIMIWLGYLYIISISIENDALRILQTAKYTLLTALIPFLIRFIEPLRYFVVRFEEEQDKEKGKDVIKEIKHVRSHMLKTIIVYGLITGIFIVFIFAISFFAIYDSDENAVNRVMSTIISGIIIFLFTTSINVYLYKDTKRMQIEAEKSGGSDE